MRAVDSFESKPVAGTEDLTDGPFLSPDGNWLGFFSVRGLEKVSINGGSPLLVCETIGGPNSATWSSTGEIIYSARNGERIWKVPASGGTLTPVTTVETSKGELGHFWPEISADGNTLLFTITTTVGPTMVAQSLKTGERKTVLERGYGAHYVSSGHLLYVVGATLMAAPFNWARMQLTAPPVPVLDGVMQQPGGWGEFSASANGSLVYVPGGIQTGELSRFVWVDRNGKIESLPSAARTFNQFSLSPDGKRVAVAITEGSKQDIWV